MYGINIGQDGMLIKTQLLLITVEKEIGSLLKIAITSIILNKTNIGRIIITYVLKSHDI